MTATPVYMDNNATTRVDPRVLDAMLPYFGDRFGNASSRSHAFGWAAEEAVETARAQVADILGANAKDVIFTSGATESDNLALRGVFDAYADTGAHIITCTTEHPAVLDTCRWLERTRGAEITYLSVDASGRLDPAAVRDAITDRTILVSVMFANNEIGVIHPIAEIGAITHAAGVLFHCDAVQAVGKVPIDVEAMHIDLLSVSAHKMYGPKGVGAVYVRRRGPRVRLVPILEGGGQENRVRPGTLNVPGIVGLGAACAVAAEEMPSESARLLAQRTRLVDTIRSACDGVHMNGDPVHRLPGNANLAFDHVNGEALLLSMRDVALSSGSACTSTSTEASHVLMALGIGEERAHSSVRFGLGRFTTDDEVTFVAERTIASVRRLRADAPLAVRAGG